MEGRKNWNWEVEIKPVHKIVIWLNQDGTEAIEIREPKLIDEIMSKVKERLLQEKPSFVGCRFEECADATGRRNP